VANGKVTRELSIKLREATARLHQAEDKVSELVRSVAEKPGRLQEARRARERDLQRLLATSFDAIVVTDVDHRVVAANPIALQLFGISKANLRKFTIDVFLSRGQISYFDATGSPVMGEEKRHGECKIWPLDGNLWVAEYIFIANFVPFRHLYRFRNERESPPRKQTNAFHKKRHWSH
jgi:PAS domain-containing protein